MIDYTNRTKTLSLTKSDNLLRGLDAPDLEVCVIIASLFVILVVCVSRWRVGHRCLV